VSSQHDRSFIWSGDELLKDEAYLLLNNADGEDEAWGNTGACPFEEKSDVPTIDCSSMDDGNGVIQAEECPEKCDFSCNQSTSFCDCGSSTCKPRQGFVEEEREESVIDLCDAARCEHGRCTATFLGGSIPVNSNDCVCDEGWSGPLCQYNDSQNGVPKIEPTHLPTRQPTIHPTFNPHPNPSPEPEPEHTYCGCPQRTQAVWDTLACDESLGGCHTCGGRISWLQSNNGDSADEACKTVSGQFSTGPCGVCNPLLCNSLFE